MSDWPISLALPAALVTISPWSACSFGGAAGGGLGTPASATYPTANRALFVPFRIARPFLARLMLTWNGAAVSGNLDLGLYSEDFSLLRSVGSTAQAGANSVQAVSLGTPYLFGPGLFYLAVAFDNTVGTLFRAQMSATAVYAALAEVTQASAFPLPDPAVPVTTIGVANYIPAVAVCGRSVA